MLIDRGNNSILRKAMDFFKALLSMPGLRKIKYRPKSREQALASSRGSLGDMYISPVVNLNFTNKG